MERILIRHLSGARASQVDEFPAGETNEILVGRDPEASVRFDPSREDLVSRQHVKIVRDPESPGEFAVVDLQSRNGTFLNRQRVYAPARLTHNDVIQLGPAGPEFRFELDPPPHNITRLVDPAASGMMMAPARGGDGTHRPIGRATVERMLGDTFTKVKHESDKAVWVGAAALTAILVVGGGTYMYIRQTAFDAGAQAQQNQQLIQQVGQDIRKTPAMADAMRKEVERLNEQLKLSEAKSEERARQLSQELAREKAEVTTLIKSGTPKNRVELPPETPRQPQADPTPPPPDKDNARPTQPTAQGDPPPPPPDVPASTPATSQPPQSAGKADYDAAVRQGIDLLQNGDANGAMKVAEQLMKNEPLRWEAYSIAGSVAKALNKNSEARTLFQKALSLAPDEIKPSLQQALEEIGKG